MRDRRGDRRPRAAAPPAPTATNGRDRECGERPATTAAASGAAARGRRSHSDERRPEVGERLGHEHARVRERRDRGGRRAAATARDAARHEQPREPVGREERRGHHRRVQVLRGGVARRGRAEPPRRREEVRVERAERDGVAAELERARGGRPPRDSAAHCSSSMKSHGRRVLRRLPRVEDQQDDVGDEQRIRREQPVEPSAARSACALHGARRRGPRAGRDRPRGGRSGTTTSSLGAARTIVVEHVARGVRDRHEHGFGMRLLEDLVERRRRCRRP